MENKINTDSLNNNAEAIRQDANRLWVNTEYIYRDSKMHPVVLGDDKEIYLVSDDETTLCFDISIAFRSIKYRYPMRLYSEDERTDIIHTYIENHIPDFYEKVECLMLKTGLFKDRYHFTIDCKILKKTFPKLNSIYCNDALNIVNTTDEICILNPFELGELSFLLARDRDIAMANGFLQELCKGTYG